MKRRASVWIAALAASVAVLWCLERLLMPKYMGKVIEGNLTEEYYKETTGHDVLILGNCEAYENLPADTLSLYTDLWVELGIG